MRGVVVCDLCPRACRIPDGSAGDCRIRVNMGGRLIATTYGRPSAIHVDPIEKKPLNHFLPGSGVFSIATAGCNLHCKNCQNWQLSQRSGEEMEVRYRADPAQIVSEALRTRCLSIAYTYSDPSVFYEYAYDTSVLARKAGLKNVLVTAGYLNPGPLRRLCRYVDGSNTDLKYFDDDSYMRYSEAHLKPVLNSLVIQKETGVWLEVTNLMIPTLNDDMKKVRAMSKWMVKELGDGTPLHFSRFFPLYKMRNLPPTPAQTLEDARKTAMDAGLQYVYCGNLHGDPAESTYCPKDGKVIIRRAGYRIIENHIKDGKCGYCGTPIPGVWKS